MTNLCGLGSTVFIEKSRSDYMFFGKASSEIVSVPPFGIDALGFLLNPAVDGTVDNMSMRYLGTVILEATPNANGVFTVAYFKNPNATFLSNANAGEFDGNTYQDLIINFGGTPPPNCEMIVGAIPANCEVDGRQPHDIANALPAQGITSIDLTLSNPCVIGNLSPASFALAVTPAGGTPPTITNVSGAGNVATLTLSGPILPQKWTCISRVGAPAGNDACIGFLPGDVDANLTANTADVNAAISSLNGIVPEPLIGTDTNRSTVHTSEDLLRLVDLANGAGAYNVPPNPNTLPACPP